MQQNTNNQHDQNNQNQKIFVNDQFNIDGVILCKYITTLYSEECEKTIGSNKLMFDLADDPINDQIINQLKTKEMYFLKKINEICNKNNRELNFPICVKTFLNPNSVFEITQSKIFNNSVIILKKNMIKNISDFGNKENEEGEEDDEKSTHGETSTTITDSVNKFTLKVKLNLNEKNIKPYKSTSQEKISINELIQLVRSENLKLRVKINCTAVYFNNTLFINANLLKIGLEQSKMIEVYNELKNIKNNNTTNLSRELNKKNKISKFPTKSSTITQNILNIIVEQNEK